MDRPTRDPGTDLFLLGVAILFLALAGRRGVGAHVEVSDDGAEVRVEVRERK